MDVYEQRLEGLCKYKKIVAGVIRVWVFFFLSFLKAFYWYCFYNESFVFFLSEKDKKNRFWDFSGLRFIFELSNVFSYK